MKTAQVWLDSKEYITIVYTTFSSEVKEEAYFFMRKRENVAIVPWKFLIVFNS